jgi:hypothetical protein
MSDTPYETNQKLKIATEQWELCIELSKRLERERDEARKVLLEIANASHFDNIGNWARNKAREALGGAK